MIHNHVDIRGYLQMFVDVYVYKVYSTQRWARKTKYCIIT